MQDEFDGLDSNEEKTPHHKVLSVSTKYILKILHLSKQCFTKRQNTIKTTTITTIN